MTLVYIGKQSEFEDRGRKVVSRGAMEIGVFFIDGEFFAYENRCSHVGGPVCQGRILNRVVEDLNDDLTSQGQRWSDEDVHIICPWHGYEFNLKTGRHPGSEQHRLRSFPVTIKDGDVYVTV